MLGALLSVAGCARLKIPEEPARLRLLASNTSRATWVFSIEDHAQSGSFFFDGRPRPDACVRRGRRLECQLRGLFPGGHTFELRLPGALLRRSAVIGVAWPEHPLLTTARLPADVAQAADARLDGIVIPRDAVSEDAVRELVWAAHGRGLRAFVEGDSSWIERAGADGSAGIEGLPPELARRYPGARALGPDRCEGPSDCALKVGPADGVILDRGSLGLGAALKRARPFSRADRVEIDQQSDGPIRRTRRSFVDGSEVIELLINESDDRWPLPPGARLLYVEPASNAPASEVPPRSVAVVERGASAPDVKQY